MGKLNICIVALCAVIQGCATHQRSSYGSDYANRDFSSLGKNGSWSNISPSTAGDGPSIAVSAWSDKNDVDLAQNIRKELDDKAAEGKLLDRYNYDISYERVPVSGLEMSPVASAHEFDVSMATVSFPSGAYNISQLTGVIRFTNCLANTIRKMRDYANQHGADVRYSVTYIGIADGIPTTNALYKGEFGDVNIDTWLLNGSNQNAVRIERGQKLTNPQLALLRAYAGKMYFEKTAKKYGLIEFVDSHINAETHDEVGQNARLLKIRIEVLPRG